MEWIAVIKNLQQSSNWLQPVDFYGGQFWTAAYAFKRRLNFAVLSFIVEAVRGYVGGDGVVYKVGDLLHVDYIGKFYCQQIAQKAKKN